MLTTTQIIAGDETQDVITVSVDTSQPEDAQVIIRKAPLVVGQSASGVAMNQRQIVMALGDLPNLVTAAQKVMADYQTKNGAAIVAAVTPPAQG